MSDKTGKGQGADTMSDKIEKSDEEWRKELTPEQYRIARQKGTERAFTGEYYDSKEPGTYKCVCCGTPLFDSRLPPGKAESVLEHIAEGCGVRQSGRLCKVNRGTVGRLGRIAGEHSRDLHDELVAISPPHARGPVR